MVDTILLIKPCIPVPLLLPSIAAVTATQDFHLVSVETNYKQ